MARCGLSFMEVTLELIITMPKQHYYNPKHTWQLYPRVGPTLVKAMLFRLRWGRSAMLGHLYNFLGLWVGPLPHRQLTFYPSPKS
jgi:hypothetical protein